MSEAVVGEKYTIAVNKSIIDCNNCKISLYRCEKTCIACEETLVFTTNLYEKPNSNRHYFETTVFDISQPVEYTILIDGEVFYTETIDLENFGQDIELNGNTLKVYFNYPGGSSIKISGPNISTRTSVCYNKSNYMFLDFCMPQKGCYRFYQIKDGEPVVLSNNIQVLDSSSKTTLVEYPFEGIMLRHRIPMYLQDLIFEQQVDERELSSGVKVFNNLKTHVYQRFIVDVTSDYLPEIQRVLKRFYMGGKRVSVANMDILPLHRNKHFVLTGRVYHGTDTQNDCGETCQEGSFLTYKSFE